VLLLFGTAQAGAYCAPRRAGGCVAAATAL